MDKYISSPSKTAGILKEFDIKLRKSLGQNFLIDTNILKKITRLSGIESNETILEVGSGIGSLTEILLDVAGRVICVEVDKRLSGIFMGLFRDYSGSKVVLIEQDAMKLDYSLLAKKYGIKKMVANLPYKIAAPLVLKILVEAPGIKKMYLTIQKDIAERLTAKKGDKNYSSFSVKANFLAKFKVLFIINRTCFVPVPFVDSVFIEVSRKAPGQYDFDRILPNGKSRKKLTAQQVNRLFSFIDACFRHRRKKMLNSLADSGDSFITGKIDAIAKVLDGMGKGRGIRAEELEVEDFLRLFLALESARRE